jgi:hypothetical protein
LSRDKLFLLAYPILLFFSGIFQNPLFACIIAALYELGLVGLVTIYDARFKAERSNQFLYGFLGVLLLFISLAWLEILVQIMPFMDAY